MTICTRGSIPAMRMLPHGRRPRAGAAFAHRLAVDGDTALALDVAPEPEKALPGVTYRRRDVTDPQAWKALAAALEAGPPVAGLVANAAAA